MLDDNAIRVSGVGKCYQIYNTPQDRLKQSFLGRRRKYYREFWALRNVSFSVRKGESVGIIGRNGSGKSTLLQIIAGTLRATTGDVSTEGRIAALLELGSGFNPEFTGRENVYLNASILGLSREETDRKLDAIAAFADIGEFIDHPVNTYSDGMVLRLAFAVQVQIEPAILIIDEALSVGDELFQRKCFAALTEFLQKGRTLLIVSHAGELVKELCGRALLLDMSEMIMFADSKTTVDEYHRFLFANEEEKPAIRRELKSTYAGESPERPVVAGAPGGLSAWEAGVGEKEGPANGDFHSPDLVSKSCVTYASRIAVIRNARIQRQDGSPVNHLIPMRTYQFVYDVEFMAPATGVLFSMMIKSKTGLELGGNASEARGRGIPLIEAGAKYRVTFEFAAYLLPGIFYLNCGVTGSSGKHEGFLARLVDCVAFRVLARNQRLRAGYVDLGFSPAIERMDTRAQ